MGRYGTLYLAFGPYLGRYLVSGSSSKVIGRLAMPCVARESKEAAWLDGTVDWLLQGKLLTVLTAREQVRVDVLRL
jgi:hypothetical protein